MKHGWYILLYHNISWEENPYVRGIGGTLPPDIFRDHLAHLKEIGEFVSIQEGLLRLNKGNITNPVISFWFDDGLSGVGRYAAPLLKQFNTTGALSACSRFWNREELFWRFKLSYLQYVDGIRFLRQRFRTQGLKQQMSIKNFTLDSFSESIVEEIDNVFRECTSQAEREDAFRLFETSRGLLELQKKGWVIANHTAAHYPIEKENAEKYFVECENEYKKLFGEESQFWVLPFTKPGYYTKDLIDTLRKYGDKRTFVLVGNKINANVTAKEKTIFRIDAPLCSGADLIRFIKTEAT